MTAEYEKIYKLQKGAISREDYEVFKEKSLKAKKEIIDKLGGKTKVWFKLNNDDAISEQAERDFKIEFKNRYKEVNGIEKGFFKLASILNSSDVLNNRHSSGKRMTKVIGEVPELGEDYILMYSQIKNSYILPNSYLVVSVEPFDFVTMGLGKGWTTCYRPGGEHNTGGYSLALDKNSFVTYVTSIEPQESNYFDYEAKLYRRLGVFSDTYSTIKLSTQYPYKNQGIEDFSLHSLKELFFKDVEGVTIGRSDSVKLRKKSLSQIYNDYTMGSSAKKEEAYISKTNEPETIVYGSIVKCLSCKEEKAETYIPLCEKCQLEKSLQALRLRREGELLLWKNQR